MRNPLVQFAAVVLGALFLIGGVFLGLSPLTAQVTTATPPGTQVQASCGFHYLPAVPALAGADPVPLPTDKKVLIARAEYTAACDRVTSWHPYVAWTLTGIGLLGFAVLILARRQRAADESKFGGPVPPVNPLWR